LNELDKVVFIIIIIIIIIMIIIIIIIMAINVSLKAYTNKQSHKDNL